MVKFRHKNMVVKGRPVSVRDEADKLTDDTASKWTYFFRRNSASIFIFTIFVIPNISAFIWPYMRTFIMEESASPNITFRSAKIKSLDEDIPIAQHQIGPIRKPFSVNYANVMRIRKENMGKYNYNYNLFGIDKRSNLSLQEFYDVYDGKWPVIVTDVIPKWQAYNWSRDFFMSNYGKERVTMKAVDHTLDIAIQDMFPLLHDLEDDLDLYKQGGLDNAVSLALPLELFYKNTHRAYPQSWTYVEDELFIPMRPELKDDIGDCVYMDEDFFMLFPQEIRPWNAMLLWGTQYSRSSLHMDPYNWTGTNAVIKGRKRWRLYPPGQDHFLYVMPGKNSGFPLNSPKYNSPIDAYEPNRQKFPMFAKATAIEFDQLPGEMLFIPTGWFHQAYNMEETIAISSQVMNRNNFRIILEEILKGNNLKRSDIPKDFDEMSALKKVETLMKLLPKEVLARGKAVTENVLHQIKYGDRGGSYPKL